MHSPITSMGTYIQWCTKHMHLSAAGINSKHFHEFCALFQADFPL